MFHRSSRTWYLVLLFLLLDGVLLLNRTTLRAQQPEYWVDTNQHVNRWPPPGQAWPLRRIWGVDSNEFWLSAYVASYAPDTAITGSQGLLNYQNWWRLWTDTVGLKIVETRDKIWSGGATYYSTTPERIDAIVRAARPKVGSVWGDRLIITPNHFDYTGSARELVLFPFDTNNSALWHAHFTQISGGSIEYNPGFYSLPHGRSTQKMYDNSNTTPGQVVLSRMLVGYDSTYHQHEAVATLAGGLIEDSVYNGPNLYFGSGNDNFAGSSTIFGLRGHLYAPIQGGRGVSVGLNDTLFFIDVYTVHLIGATYFNHVLYRRDTADTVTRLLFASLPVLKRDLLPKDTVTAINWDEFREAAKPLRLFDTNASGVRGPFDPTSASRDFDISIRWTGKEKAALRLVTIRDTMTHLLFGPDTAGNRGYRNQTLRWLNRMLVGPLYGALDSAAQSSGDSTHLDSAIAHSLASVIRVNAGDEGSMLINAGFTWCDSTLYRYYAPRSPLSTGDSVTRGFRAFRAMGRDATVQASQNELVCEMGYLYADYNTPPSIQSMPKRYDTAAQFNYVTYGVATPRLMAIREHNGGSFGIPELALNSYDIARNTDLYQRSLLGWYSTGRTDQFYDAACRRMGQVAAISRRTGRPLIVYQGTHTTQHVRWVYDSTVGRRVPLPLFLPTHEPSQIRLSANLGLCYGARGLHFSYLGNSLSEFNDVVGMDSGGYAGHPMRMTNYDSDWGPIGPTTNRREDYLDTLVLAETNYTGADRTVIKLYRSAPGDSVYMGWGVRMEAVTWLTQSWVPTITPALMKLRWRDSYSISFTDSLQLTVDTNINHHVANPAAYPANITSGQMRLNANAYQHYRPIPSNEIIQGVRTYDRWGNLDSISRTYVEVGLFDPIPNTIAPGYDTNYVYVVNRRTFERSGEISPTSPRGKAMDSLAEWRKVFVQLRMNHPDSSRYNYVRVREQPGTADTTRAPWWNASRTPLDTVVNTDSAVALWMRPGGGALLQISYVKPGDLLSGVLAFNNAKRVFFDGLRYHVALTSFEFGKDDTTSYYDKIYYFWSQPVDSVERAVRWSGPGSGGMIMNYTAVGCDGPTRWQNRHPALTVRRIGDSALVTVVWTSHPSGVPPAPATREVMTRSLMLDSSGNIVSMGNMLSVGFYRGSNPTGSGIFPPPPPGPTSTLSSSFWGAWGTPVVSTLDGAEVFAWSDSLAGIVARLHTTGTAHLPCVPVFWSNYDTVSKSVASSFDPTYTVGKAQWPTMPPVAHVASLDSNVGIAWQNNMIQQLTPYPHITYRYGNVIYYKRLVHSGTPLVPVLSSQNDYVVTPMGFYEHPSLDLWQDVWYQCFEGVAWEEKTGVWPNFGSTLWFRPVVTETRFRGSTWSPFWDSIGVTWGWAPYSHIVRPSVGGPPSGYLDLWPSAAPLNEIMVPADSADTAHFAIAYVDSANTMSGPVLDLWQTQVYYGMSTATPGFPKRYSFSGFHPAMSGTATKQETRAIVLYESDHDANAFGDAVIGPTNQFFARLSRPRGYLATGREVMLLDEGEAGATVGMMDLWLSDDDSSRSLAMTARASTRTFTDTLGPALDLVRSTLFTTHDSVAVGVHTRARLAGDSGYVAGVGMSIRLRWELVEESSGSVVAVLDSATVDAAHPAHDSLVVRVLDVVSGSYRVRMTADTLGIALRALSQQESRWPVVETSIWVDELAAKLVRTGEAKGSTMRLDVQPNPATDHAEVMVSVPKEGEVRIVLHTVEGRAVGVVYAGRLDRGRYSVPVALSNLTPGVYMVEMMTGRERLVRQLIVR